MNARALKILAATKLLPLLALLALPAEARSQTYSFYTTPHGYLYYEENSGAITIDSYSGSDTTLDIPSTINDLPVTSIGFGALANNNGITSVTISNGITSIGDEAFMGCTSLTSVAIPDSITSIGFLDFYNCFHLTSVTIPDSVNNIGYQAFYDCISLTSVTIPDSVTSISYGMFYSCTGLTNVTVGNGVTSIGNYAFGECTNLTAVYFQGNSPTPNNDSTVFAGDTPGVVYYLSNTTGWDALFDGWPTMSNVVSSAVGHVTEIQGNVQVTHPDGSKTALQLGDPIVEGDVIETEKQSGHVSITFADNSEFQISQNAKLAIDQYVYDPNTETGSADFRLLRGAFLKASGLLSHQDPDADHVHVAYGSIGIRGTQFIVQPDPCASGEMIYLIEGELAITPTNTPGVTNICDGPVTILLTASSVTTNALDQATYDSISNTVFQTTAPVTFTSWIAQYYCTNDPTAAAGADPDGDGQSNYAEFLAGTDPDDAASCFHILSVAPQGNNVLVSWMCGGGQTNILQATTNPAGTWSDLSPNIVLGSIGDTVTNYLDVGALTNTPARFYRVQLVR